MVLMVYKIMKAAISQLAGISPVKAAAILGLVFLVIFAASCDFLSGHYDRACENICEDCSDCVTCSPTLHMLSDSGPDFRHIDHVYGWHIPLPSPQRLNILSTGIDHPPRNIS
ncbi:MAG: hypothetical protein CVT49_09470 [candidate division Zixibacteria bacterium HGW-Zixibacteria-1]|nr:MAG: hypothetical protein CVT49_09470 [candidate division Zixibacteria bacterium HGW-Zixibacteria-1]